MKRTMIELDAPAFWAAYLVNGDTEGLDARDFADLHHWLATNDLRADGCLGIVDEADSDSDAHFIGRFDFPMQGTLQCDMYTYTFLLDGDTK